MYYIQSKQNHNVLHLLLYNYYISFSFFADLQKKYLKPSVSLTILFFYPLTQSNTTLRGARNVSCKHEAKNVNPQKRERFLNKCSQYYYQNYQLSISFLSRNQVRIRPAFFVGALGKIFKKKFSKFQRVIFLPLSCSFGQCHTRF